MLIIYFLEYMGQNILGIDRGKKNMGLAYIDNNTGIAQPIGSIKNDSNLFIGLGSIIYQHAIIKIVVGLPTQIGYTKKSIEHFATQLAMIVDKDIPIILYDEDYTSVIANARSNTYIKDSREDTISAMILLENYRASMQ